MMPDERMVEVDREFLRKLKGLLKPQERWIGQVVTVTGTKPSVVLWTSTMDGIFKLHFVQKDKA